MNQVLNFDVEDNEGYADSNILEMHADGASFAADNACPADNADYSNGNEHQNKEEDNYEEIIESVLNPEEPTAEEIEMDKMFANKKYPTMQEISEASTPTVGMEFDSKEDAFFFFAVCARRVGFAIKKDSTYESKKTNAISRQSFAWVDNYGKTVIFGVGLLEDERADTFKWLFVEFLSAMDNKHLETIITDRDVAMSIAISKALPFTIHRFCNFHISKNLDEKLSQFFAIRGTLKEDLRAVTRNSFTPEEFETEWHDLLQHHNALAEPHLDMIYEIRAQWVPAYFKESFFPFTSSTGRSESTNSLFKHYVKRKDLIGTFFKEYMIIQEKKQSDLDGLREKSELKESANWGFNPLEREAMKIYTDPIYGKFADELRKGTTYNVEVVEEKTLYRLVRIANYRNAEFPRTTYMVSISLDEDVYKCSCSKMARDGIQC
ncbi:hypothetical protein ACQ4PT_049302 [Festuca glaucescens]